MNFTELKQKLRDATAPLGEKAAPFLEKAKNVGFQALDFTQKQLQNTPLVLKSIDEYKDFVTKKRAIIISYNETDILSREVLLRMPVWSTKAWSDTAEVRLIETSKENEIATFLGINTPIDMRVWYIGEETFHATDIRSIIEWWETCCYEKKSDDELNDPLAGK